MKTADKIDNKIVAKFNFPFGDNRFNETLQQIKKINGSVFDKSKRVWNLPLTKTTYEDLISSGFEINRGLEDWYLDSSLKNILKPKIEIDGLFPFQNEGVAFVEYCQGRAFIADECGCIFKDAQIIISRNGGARQITLKKLYEKFNGIKGRWDLNIETFTRSLNTETNQFRLNKIIGVIHKGFKPVYKLITDSHNIEATADHIFFSESGEKELRQLKIGEKIFVNGQKICLQCGTDKKIITYKYAKFRGYCKNCVYKHLRSNNPNSIGESIDKDGYIVVTKNLTYHPYERVVGIYKHRLVYEAFINNVSYDKWLEIIKYNKFKEDAIFLPPYMAVHHKDGNRLNNDIENLEYLSHSEHRKKHDNYKNFKELVIPKLEKIVSIEYAGEEEVFDIQMQSPFHNFIANGIVVHNCGKTMQAIAWLNLHQDKTPIIIVCPATIKEKWKYEIPRWSSFKESDIILLSGRTSFEIPKDKKIVIINYDVLQYWLEPLMQISPKVLVGDEIHFCKNSSSQRSKAMKILSQKIPHIIGLSGTPIENRPIEFFNALNMIRPDVFPNKFKYALKFCNAKKNQWGWDLTGSSNREELHKLLTDTVMIRRKKVDVLPQLPTKTRSLIPITIDNMKEYWEAQNDIISWIEKNEGSGKALRAMGSETLVKIVKLQQITSKGKIDSAISWIEDFIEETEEKLVVFCKFTNTIDILKEKFKNSCVVIDGRTPTKDRMRIIDDEFVNNKEKRLFIGNIQIAVGFNLTVSSNALYIEHSFKPSDHLQSEDRLVRIGTKNAVTCWYLIALHTIDEIIVNTIHKKMKIIDVIIDGASECGDEDSALDEIMHQLKESKNKID